MGETKMGYLKLDELDKPIKFFDTDWTNTMDELSGRIKRNIEKYMTDGFCTPLGDNEGKIISSDQPNMIKISKCPNGFYHNGNYADLKEDKEFSIDGKSDGDYYVYLKAVEDIETLIIPEDPLTKDHEYSSFKPEIHFVKALNNHEHKSEYGVLCGKIIIKAISDGTYIRIEINRQKSTLKDKTVNTPQIANNAITTDKVKRGTDNSSLTGEDIYFSRTKHEYPDGSTDHRTISKQMDYLLARIDYITGIKFVAVGSSGYIYTSENGTDWSGGNKADGKELRGVAYGKINNKVMFVAVGRDGSIFTSENGTDWTERKKGGKHLEGVAYGKINNKVMFVAVGDDGYIFTSENGTDWTERKKGGKHLRGVAYGKINNKNMFVAVGFNGYIFTSENGTDWTGGNKADSKSLEGVAYGKINNKVMFVAVGWDGSIFTSENGTDWTERKKGGKHLWGVAYGKINNKVMFVAVGDDGYIFTSENGTDWIGGNKAGGEYLRGVAYGKINNKEMFVAVGNEGYIFTSENGTDWTERKKGGKHLRGVAYKPFLF